MIGKTISHYCILEKLGEGGMGVVYKARDTKLDRIVALKFLPPGLVASSEDVARFKQEAKAISSLSHPHIATIHDIEETTDQQFLVLEYLSGGTLKTKVQHLATTGKTLPLRDIIEYGLDIAEGLAHAHRHGITHRDVKTENIMLTEEGAIKITDFGLARIHGSVHLTKSGSTLGTVAYMSPEQIRGEDADHRSDLFSFGVILFELVTGRLPFRGEHEAAMSYSIVNEDPLPLGSSDAIISSSLGNVIYRCLEKNKEKRYQAAEEIAADLRKIQMEISGYAIPATLVGKLSRRSWLIASASVILIVMGIYVFVPSKLSSVDAHSIAVLPFRNYSTEKENDIFSDGITEEVTTQLAMLRKLKVMSHRSMMQYKGTKHSLKDIGKELGVSLILDGSVRRDGHQIRVDAQLIDVASDNHLWAQIYDREFTQIFTIQKEIAEDIALRGCGAGRPCRSTRSAPLASARARKCGNHRRKPAGR